MALCAVVQSQEDTKSLPLNASNVQTNNGQEWISWIGSKSQKISVLYPWSKLKTITKLPMKPENRQLLKISSALRLQVLTKLTQVVGWLSKARSGLYLSI